MSTSWDASVSTKDQMLMDWAEISAIRAWLDARNSGRPYRMAYYHPEVTLTRLRWLLTYAERVGRPEKRKSPRPPKAERDKDNLIANYVVELTRLWKIENRYEAMLRSSRSARSRAGGRR